MNVNIKICVISRVNQYLKKAKLKFNAQTSSITIAFPYLLSLFIDITRSIYQKV